jgi:hypothetical protein
MASASNVAVDVGNLVSQFTMHVRMKGVRLVKVRLFLAQLIMALAARVAGCKLEISVDDAPSSSWQRISLQPTDVLVVQADSLLSDAQRERIREQFKIAFPSNEVVVLDYRLSVQGAITRAITRP